MGWRGSIQAITPDDLPDARSFLTQSSTLYPGIESWWDQRVVPGLNTGSRTCRLAFDEGRLVALCIGKRSGHSAKICTLRVDPKYQGVGLGHRLFAGTICDLAGDGCRHLHFTLSEAMCESSQAFFETYGFSHTGWSRSTYVRGDDELFFTAASEKVIHAIQARPWVAPAFIRHSISKFFLRGGAALTRDLRCIPMPPNVEHTDVRVQSQFGPALAQA